MLDICVTQWQRAVAEASKQISLGEVISIEDSKRIPLSSQERGGCQGKYPYYGAAGILDHVDNFLFDGVRLLLGEDGTVMDSQGRPSLQYVWGKYWVNNHAHVLSGTSGATTEQLFVALLDKNISEYVTGAVQPKLNQRNLNSIALNWPDSVPTFEDEFLLYRTKCDEIGALERLRDALLPKLMSGEIDVSKVDVTPPNNHL